MTAAGVVTLLPFIALTLSAVVVMLAGSRSFSGPVAAGVAGAIYRSLSEQRYFAADTGQQPVFPEIISTSPCCSH